MLPKNTKAFVKHIRSFIDKHEKLIEECKSVLRKVDIETGSARERNKALGEELDSISDRLRTGRCEIERIQKFADKHRILYLGKGGD